MVVMSITLCAVACIINSVVLIRASSKPKKRSKKNAL